MEGASANIYLRRLGDQAAAVPLLEPRICPATRRDNGILMLSGDWRGLRFMASIVLAERAPAWFWHVALENQGRVDSPCDLGAC